MKILISFFCSFYSVSKISLFPSSKRHLRNPKMWRYISTVLLHKHAHLILQLLSCVIRSAYDWNPTNPSSNFSFFRDLCIVISDYYCSVIFAPLSIYVHFLLFWFLQSRRRGVNILCKPNSFTLWKWSNIKFSIKSNI